MTGLIEEENYYLRTFKNVYVGAVGASFYEQVLPSNSVDIGFTVTATHWLHRKFVFTIIFTP